MPGGSDPKVTHGPATCAHLPRNSLELCGADAIVTFDYGLAGVGACRRHAGLVLLWCMETGRGEQPDRSVTAAPTWAWDAA